MPTTIEFKMGQRTLIDLDPEEIHAYLTAWQQNINPFISLPNMAGETVWLQVSEIIQIIPGDKRTAWDRLRDEGRGDEIPHAGASLAQSLNPSSTDSAESSEPPS